MVITYNEEANIRDTLSCLEWATNILIVDSGSNDQTLTICKEFKNVNVVYRKFENFAEQCNFGLTQIDSNWVLSLDADYKCTAEFIEEVSSLKASATGFRAPFRYCIYGKPLRSSLYPPRVVLYQKANAVYRSDGHGHAVDIDGMVEQLQFAIRHDDRKPLSVWLASQHRYAKHEADKLLDQSNQLDWKDRLRTKIVLATPLTLVYCLIVKRLLFDGWAGIYYTLQRVYAELLLALELLDRRLH